MKGSGGGPGGTGDLEAEMSHGLVGNSGVIRMSLVAFCLGGFCLFDFFFF